jgi:hypothetical protein
MAKHIGPIIGMMALSCGLSILLIVLGKAFPKQTMYFLIAFTFVAYIIVIILGFVMGNTGLGITFCVIMAIHAIILYCLW